MHLPARRALNRVRIGGGDQRRENVAQASHEVGAQFAAVVVFDQTQKPAMLDAPDYHRWSVRSNRTLVKDYFRQNAADAWRKPIREFETEI
jgi:hypothetical protein